MEVTGIIKKIGEVQNVTDTFRKRELVVTTEEQYPQHILIEFVQDRVNLLDKFKEGDKVTIGINLRGREWTSPQGEVKYFNSLHGWKIDLQQSMNGSAAPVENIRDIPPMPPMGENEEDDLPF